MLTHWKKLHNPDYLGAWDFQPDEKKLVTIKNVLMQKVTSSSGSKEDCSVCFFCENIKPMILNVTNSKSIQSIADTPYIENWKDVKIELYCKKVKAFGEVVDAVRVKKPANVEVLDKNHPKWNSAIESIRNGQTTIEAVKKHYTITNEAETELKKCILPTGK